MLSGVAEGLPCQQGISKGIRGACVGRPGKQVSNPLEIKQHAGSGDQEPARGGDRREVVAQGRGGGGGFFTEAWTEPRKISRVAGGKAETGEKTPTIY